MSSPHDLFLLMLSLYQMRDRDEIIRIFTESINSQFQPTVIKYTQDEAIVEPFTTQYPIRAKSKSYGYILVKNPPSDRTTAAILRNSVALLGIILENNSQGKLLENENLRLDTLVNDKTKEIKAANDDLKALNMNLKNEAQERAKSEEMFRSLFRNAPIGINIFNIQEGKVVKINDEGLKILGYASTEGKGLGIEDIEIVDSKTIESDFKAFETSELIHRETQFKRKNGEVIDVLLRVTKMDIPNLVIAMYMDITDMKTLRNEREELVHTLENKKNELEMIINIATHDLRGPLVNIQGFSSELQHISDEIIKNISNSSSTLSLQTTKSSQELKESTTLIIDSTFQMDLLIRGLLTLSRINRNKVNIKKIDMNQLLSTVINSLSYQIKENNISVNYKNLENCAGDQLFISQIFSNILDNSIKYRSKKPCTIDIDSVQNNTHVVYTVKDNGKGIQTDKLKRIFEPFYRAEKSNSLGEGLGLAIVRKSVEMLNGKISMESTLGEGTTTRIELPKKTTFFHSYAEI